MKHFPKLSRPDVNVAIVALIGAVTIALAGGIVLGRQLDDSSSGPTDPSDQVELVTDPEPSGNTQPGDDTESATTTQPIDNTEPAGDAPSPSNTEPAGDTASPADTNSPNATDLSGASTGPRLDGAWSTAGTDIVDADGDVIVLRGVNWFGLETGTGAPHGLWSRGLDDMLDQIAELGFNTIRVPFSAAMLDDDGPAEGIDQQANPELAGKTSLEVLDAVVDGAGARGLAIILDRHALAPDDRHHLWYDDAYPAERLAEDWVVLAERYRDMPQVVGADLYNEPHDEACWGCGDPRVDWKAAAEQVGDAIHAVAPEWLIFVEGVEHVDGASCDGAEGVGSCTWWGGNLSAADTDPVVLARPDKVVYSPHEYATSVFTQPWFNEPSFPDNLDEVWDEFWGHLANDAAAPILVGEFGTTLDAEVDGVWLETLLAYLDEIGAGFTFWTFNPNSGDTGGVLLDDWITVDEDKMAYLEPYLVGPFPPVAP